ncbi:GIN domain-containing protein [Kolteria novifilia]|uniref:GIN domain-containing protein n=1 Tax=Kolteria novifilia TaxID=2527975 RepID=UPI003AF36A86
MFLCCLIALLGSLAGCGQFQEGSGNRVTRTVDVGQFSALALQGSGRLRLEAGKDPSVSLTIDDNLVDQVKAHVAESQLVVELPRNTRSPKGLEVVVTVPTMKRVTLDGAWDAHIDGIHGDFFTLVIDGAGKAQGKGVVDHVELNINGSGEVFLHELVGSNVNVKISGSGRAGVHAVMNLTASIVGSGSIEYRGEPKITKRITGSGRIEPDDDDVDEMPTRQTTTD